MQLISTIIAEDDPQNAGILNRFIERSNGFYVDGIAQSLLQAKDMTEIIKPDLLLLDNHFPDGKGTDLLQHMRKQNIQTDVIMVTASKDVSTIRNALHRGIFDYIIKPISYQRLEDSLNKYRDYFSKLHNSRQLRQDDVDSLLKRNKNQVAEQTTRLPKGIDCLTLDKIRQQLKKNSLTFTADEMGQSLGISRTTARRYLEYLVSLNEVLADVTYGSVGRPERLYKKLSKQ